MKNKGLLIVNLGTPESPEPRDVGIYLREFLMDKHVINIPFIFRWILVNLIIVPFRKFKSAKNYKKVWMKEGSPLMIYTKKLTDIIKANETKYSKVEFAMRYGNPSVKEVLKGFYHFEEIDVLPLYPHETGSSVGTAIEKVIIEAKKLNIKVNKVPVFYAERFYLQNMVEHIKDQVSNIEENYFVFSYHGIPKNHLKGVCETLNSKDSPNCCDVITSKNENCYRAQCFETSRLLAEELGVSDLNMRTVFQSRLGRQEWLYPNIEDKLETFAKKGIKNIVFLSPSFVADCLETLEELAMGIREDYEELVPGANVKVLSCLNGREQFAKDLADWSYDLDLGSTTAN